MAHNVRFITLGLVVAVAAASGQAAAEPDGVLSPQNPLVTYTHGPFTGANPTNNLPGATGPDCEAIPGTCDDFGLQVILPPGYVAANPDHIILVKIQWDPTNPGNDFDLYVQDPVTGENAAPPAATSSNPEVTSIPMEDGVRNFRIRVLIFSVVNTSYTATIILGPPPGGTPGVGTYTLGTDVWTCNTHLIGLSEIPGPPPTVFNHSNDGEPSTRFDPNGRMYTTAIAGVPAGAGLWATSDACGQAYEFLGAVDAGIGGGDSDVETAPERNVLGNYNVYLSSLTLANITSAASFDGGTTFTLTPISTPTPVDDRQWNAAHGSSILYLSYWQFPSGIIQVVRLDYSGLAEPIIAGPFNVGNDALAFDRIGNLATDRRPVPGGTPPLMAGPDGEGNVYQAYHNDGGRVFVAVSRTFGATWEQHLVWDGEAPQGYDHVFVWLSVDSEGNVYAAFSDDSNIYYSVSQDQGNNWSTPIRVNMGSPQSRVAIFPQIAAGSAGRFVLSFYGHNGTSPLDPTANWKVFVTRCQNALDPVPVLEEMIVNNRNFHTGQVCENGTGCSCCRQLLECFEVDIHPSEGSAFVTYGSFGGGGSYITRQVAGKSSIEGINVPDRSGQCPVPPNCVIPPCQGDPCACPGCIVVEDFDTEDSPPPPRADQNIRTIGVAEPFGHEAGPNVLAFSMQLEDLNTSDLPPNSFWRIIFNTPAGMFYVRVTNCASGGLSGDYGHFEVGSVSDGPLDLFTLSEDGLICMYIDRANVGNPQPGQQINGINGDARLQTGNCPGGPAAFAPIDVTNSGGYDVAGNEPCATTATPGAEGTPVGAFSLGLAGANPFAGETQVSYSLPERARVRIDIYNVAGQRVQTLVNREQEVGRHTVAFAPKAAGLGAGVYWLRIKAGGFEDRIRLVALE